MVVSVTGLNQRTKICYGHRFVRHLEDDVVMIIVEAFLVLNLSMLSGAAKSRISKVRCLARNFDAKKWEDTLDRCSCFASISLSHIQDGENS